MKRKKFDSKLKTKVVIEALKAHQTVNQIATEFEVHPSQVNAWKKQFIEGTGDIFSKGESVRLRTLKMRRTNCIANRATDRAMIYLFALLCWSIPSCIENPDISMANKVVRVMLTKQSSSAVTLMSDFMVSL